MAANTPARAALLAAALASLAACRRAPPAPAADDDAATPDPASLVLAFSHTGRTTVVASELAAMTGARLVRLPAPPESDGAPLGEVRVDGLPSLGGVRRLYLGFPIRTSSPAPEALVAAERLEAQGVEVVPFYTYLHHAAPDAVAALAARLAARGATVREPMRFRFSFSMTAETIRREARRALLGREDLWPREAAARLECAPRASTGSEACKVPAGWAWVGDVADGGAKPRRLRVEAFELDRAEVSVAAYASCVTAGACRELLGGNGSSCTRLVGDRTDVPMPCAGPDEAQTYCRYAGGRVPTEAEWVRAARADTMRAFPWGDEPPAQEGPLRGNFGEKASTGLATYALVAEDAAWPSDGHAGLAPGCSFAAGHGPFGHCDLAGNLLEWASMPSGGVVLKGGSWLDPDAQALRVGARGVAAVEAEAPPFGFYLTGMRCAYDAR